MYGIQKLLLVDFAFRPDQIYLFCYLIFGIFLSIIGVREENREGNIGSDCRCF